MPHAISGAPRTSGPLKVLKPAMIVAGVSFAYGIVFMIFTVASSSSQASSEKTHSMSFTVVPYCRPFLR